MRWNTLICFTVCGVSNPPFPSLLPVSLLLAALSDTLAFASAWFLSVPSRSSWSHVCDLSFYSPRCLNVGDEAKVGDVPKPSLPSILPKKPLPPKSSSSTSSHPPRRPERPPSLASVHRQTHRKLLKVVSTKLMLLCGLPAQLWESQVWGQGFHTRPCPWQVAGHWWVSPLRLGHGDMENTPCL